MRTRLIMVVILCSVATGLMLPRLASPQFGLLDDGTTLIAARSAIENWRTIVNIGVPTGRFMPAYWAFFTGVYLVAGARPFLWFLANYFVLLGITGVLALFVRYRGGTDLQSWVAAVFFLASGPVIENAYTLSKAEPVQLGWISSSLLLMMLCSRAERQWCRALLAAGTCTALLLANLTKETSLVSIPIALGWLLTAWRWRHAHNGNRHLRAGRTFLLLTLVAGIAFVGLRSWFMPLSPLDGSYTRLYRLEGQALVVSLSRWVSWVLRDFPHLIPLTAFATWSSISRGRLRSPLVLDAAIWMAAWIAVYLPWYSLLEYYLLPFAFGAAILGAIAFRQTLSSLIQTKETSARSVAGFCLGLSLLLWLCTLANNVTNARLQLAVDAANSELVEFLARVPSGTALLVNLPDPNEYVGEIEFHLSEIWGRPDVLVDRFRFQVVPPADGGTSYYVVTPRMHNQTLPSVRIAVQDSGSAQWNQALEDFLAHDSEAVFGVERSVPLLDFGFHRLVCLAASLTGALDMDAGINCRVPRPFLDQRLFSYGWDVYVVSSRLSSVALPAVYRADAVWEFQSADGSVAELHFGEPGDVPLAADWDGDGLSEIGVFRPSDVTWYLDYDMDGRSDAAFRFRGMRSGDIPVVGDWDGNGTTTCGYFRAEDVSWHFRNTNADGWDDMPPIRHGTPTHIPIAGDWDGDGRDSIGIYRPGTGEVDVWDDLGMQPADLAFWGNPLSVPVVADWGGAGVDSVAFVAEGVWFRRFVNCNCWPSNRPEPLEVSLGAGVPLGGRWEPTP